MAGIIGLVVVLGIAYLWFVASLERELKFDLSTRAYAGVTSDPDGRVSAVVPKCFPDFDSVTIDTSDGRRLWEARGDPFDAGVRQVTLGTPPTSWAEPIPLALPLPPGTSLSLRLGSGFFSIADAGFSLEDLESGSVYSGRGRHMSVAEFMRSNCS